MHTLLTNRVLRAAAACTLVVGLILSVSFAPSQTPTAHATPAIAVVAAVVVAAAAAVIVDYFDCSFNIFFYCSAGGGSAGGGSIAVGGGGTHGARGQGSTNSNTSSQTTQQSGGAVQCVATNALCGISNVGVKQADGSCSVTPPPNSKCPAPTIVSPFYANPSRVRSGESTTLNWNVSGASTCLISDDASGGLRDKTVGLVDSLTTAGITQTTNYTLTCIEGTQTDGVTTQQHVQVTLIPAYQEI